MLSRWWIENAPRGPISARRVRAPTASNSLSWVVTKVLRMSQGGDPNRPARPGVCSGSWSLDGIGTVRVVTANPRGSVHYRLDRNLSEAFEVTWVSGQEAVDFVDQHDRDQVAVVDLLTADSVALDQGLQGVDDRDILDEEVCGASPPGQDCHHGRGDRSRRELPCAMDARLRTLR
jgi:hypothetical protein